MDILSSLTSLLLPLGIYYHLLFFWSVLKKDFSVVDIGWGYGPSLILLVLWPDPASLPQIIFSACIFLWSLRLGTYLLMRNLSKNEEDFRYAQLRKGWMPRPLVHAYFKIFLLQMLLMILTTLQIPYAFLYSPQLNAFFILGLSLFLFGFILESLADLQLSRFKKSLSPGEKKRLKSGVWSWFSHPNYVGECTLWWGLALMAMSSRPSWIPLFSPLLLTFFIVKISGVPLLKERLKNYNGP